MKVSKWGLAIAGAALAIVACTFVLLPARTAGAPAAAIPVFGGGCGSIAFDRPIKDAIANGAEVCYEFEGSAGDIVTIRMTRLGGDLDPYLKLASAGSTLTSDDDSGGNRNSLIAGFELLHDGRYAILASAYGGRTSGEFELSLSRGGAGQATPPASSCDRAIAYGQVVSDALSVPGAVCRYTFSAAADDVISVAMQRIAGSLDPSIEIADAAGNTLVSGGSYNSDRSNTWITDYRLAQSGSYTIVARSRLGQRVGPFELNLWKENRCGGDLRPGQLVYAQIADSTPTCSYALDVPTAPTTVTLVIQPLTGDLQTVLQLRSPDGHLVTESDLTVDQRVEQAGTYQVTVSGARGASGAFSLLRPGPSFSPFTYRNFRRIPPFWRIAPTAGGAIGARSGMRFGYPIAGEVRDPERLPAEYSFTGSAGDFVTIFMAKAEGSGLDPYVRLLDPYGVERIHDDDSGGGRNSLIAGYRLEATGKHTIKAGAYNAASAGQFYLTVWK